MVQKYADAARAELAASLNATDTTMTIVAGGALFPVANLGAGGALPGTNLGDWFKLVIQDEAGIEIVYVRTHASGSLTFSDVQRGRDGTTARAFTPPAVVGIRPVASDMSAFLTWLLAINDTFLTVQPALGYTPVSQGTGTGQGSNRVHVGWTASGQTPASRLRLQVDATNFADTWPISIDGTANTAANAADQPAGNNGTSVANTRHVYAATKAFGFGANTVIAANLSMASAPIGGISSYSGSVAQAQANDWPPSAGTGQQWWNVLTYGTEGTSARITQIASSGFLQGAGATYVRYKHDATWGPWRAFAFTDSPTFTGTVTVPTVALADVSEKVASTRFVFNWVSGISYIAVAGNTEVFEPQIGARVLYFVGAPAADSTVTLPARMGAWTVANGTAKNITLRSTDSSAGVVVIPPAECRNVWCVDSGIVLQDDRSSGAPLDSPNFTGTPRAPTQPSTDASTLLATTAHVRAVTGQLSLLATTDKSGLVPAINEVRVLAIGTPWGTPAGDYTIARPSGSKIVVYGAGTGNVFLPEGVERGTSYLISNRRLTPFVLAANGTGGTTGNIDETPSITVYPGETFEVFCYVYSAGGVNAWRTFGRSKEVRLVETSLGANVARIIDIDLSDPEIFDYEIALEGINRATNSSSITAQAYAGATAIAATAHQFDRWYGDAATTLARVSNSSAIWTLSQTNPQTTDRDNLWMRVSTALSASTDTLANGITASWELMGRATTGNNSIRGNGRVISSGITALRLSFNQSSSNNLNGIARISVLGRRKG